MEGKKEADIPDKQEAGGEKQPRVKTKVSDGRGWLMEWLIIVGLLLMNLVLVWRFFGEPFAHAFSAPVIPLLAGLLGFLGVDFAWGARWILLVFFILSPVSLYFFVREITRRRMSALAAAIVYSLPIFRSRFENMVVYGDGAHIAALALIPLSGYWLLRFLRRGSFGAAIAASLSVVLVALTSPFGLFILVGVLFVVTFSEMLLGQGRLKLLRFLVILLVSAGLSAFWYNPEFVRLSFTSPSGRAVVAALKNLIPISFFTLPIFGTFGFLIFDKREHLQPLFVALGLTIGFALISFAGGLARYAVSSQSRYLPELVMSIAFLWGVVGTFIYDLVGVVHVSRWFPIPKERRLLLQRTLVVVFLLACVGIASLYAYPPLASRHRGKLVLGITAPPVTGIGEIREATDEFDRLLGYGISGLTTMVMGGMYVGLRRSGGSGI